MKYASKSPPTHTAKAKLVDIPKGVVIRRPLSLIYSYNGTKYYILKTTVVALKFELASNLQM